jgi:TonB family protein
MNRSGEGPIEGATIERGLVISIAKRLRFFTAGVLLTSLWLLVFGQDKPQTPPKFQIGNGLQILTPTRGVDFSGYARDLLAKSKSNTIASLPDSVKSGETGIVRLIVQVRADGTFVSSDPRLDRSSGKNALDAAAVATIRASEPFPHFPSAFEGSSVELRITFYYNIPFKKPVTSPEPAKLDAGADPPK